MRVKLQVDPKVIVTTLNIRKGAGTSFAVIGSRRPGDTFIADKKKVLSNGEVWYKEEKKTKWSCAKLSTGKRYIKVIKDLEKKNGLVATSGAGRVAGTLIGTEGVKSPNTEPRTDSNNKRIKDVNLKGDGIPKEYKQGKPNPKTLSSAEVKSDTAEIGEIGLGVNGEPVGVYMKDQYYIYNSTNFPRYETDYDVVVPIDTLADKLNGNSNNGYYKGWVLTGVSEDKSKAYIANPNGGILSSDITIDADQTVAIKSVIDKIHRNINTPVGTSRQVLNRHTYLDFNRFKIQYPDVLLKSAVGVVFFTRPDLNIMDDINDGKNKASWFLHPQLKRDLRDYYIMMQNPAIGGLLTQRGGNIKALKNHNFNILLSNQAQGIEIIDDSVDLLEYGETFTGYKMHYSKSNTKSTAAGTLNIKFKETYDLGITNLHQVWVDYQSNVYKGIFKPKDSHIWAKELDYACNIYYFLLEEDMETILFWSKYYGCFPANVPKSTFSYDFGSEVQFPDVSVTYNYIYKTDLNPQTLVEFNQDGGSGKLPFKYAPIGVKSGKGYDTSSYSWVGVPYVATFRDEENDKLLNSMHNTDLRKSDKLRLRYRELGIYT